MDFGLVGSSNGFMGTTTAVTSTGLGSDPETKHGLYGSGFLTKQERFCNSNQDGDLYRSSKMGKTDDDVDDEGRRNVINSSIFSHCNQMLSFSSPKPHENTTLPYFNLTPSSSSSSSTGPSGYCKSPSTGYNMNGILTGSRGLFTPSQWMELEHQALIYKYINANIPIPSNLLIPIRKAFESAGFSCFPGTLLRPNTLGWGGFHLGFSNSTDPEPGRCRRTDGKKWRCSKDAVVDQKYCERHMNRGRHRSRKPVEGHTGHSVAATTTTTSKPKLTSSPASSSSVVSPNGNGSNISNSNLSIPLQPMPKRMLVDEHRVVDDEFKVKENHFLIPKQQQQTTQSYHNEFGVVSSYSLLNPSSSIDSGFSTASQNHPLRQFMDDHPRNKPGHPGILWPEIETPSNKTTQSLTSPHFMSSSSSTEKVTLSALRLSTAFDPIQMGLGVGGNVNERDEREANWVPISWETSMGGPLGEVLHSTSSNNLSAENSSGLKVMSECRENSPLVGSSPTGVLQKAVFGSLSNSSAGSSPRAENNKMSEGDYLLDSTRMRSSSHFPAL